ncbi:MAG: hypothetical protein H3Z53_12350 [archaeon]|nr:hypothetical protein [archaeon]MCP8315140.1 hypothetical protein [archaeon]
MSLEDFIPRVKKRGTGCHYAHKIKKLGQLRLLILKVLSQYENRWLRNKDVTVRVNKSRRQDNKRNITSGTTSGRLSELLGLRLVKMSEGIVQVYDEDEMSFIYTKEPCWKITETGERALEAAKHE